MFSRSDAESLREQLGEIDFRYASTDSSLIAAYRSHYGLNFPEHEIGHHIGTFTSKQFTLVCQYFAPANGANRGCVLLLHGYFDHTGLFGHLIRHCLSLGYSVLIFDLPGHGLSSGPPASIDSFKEYGEAARQCLQIAKNQGEEIQAIIGQSTGSAVVLDSLLHHSGEFDSIDHFVLLCPLLYPVGWNTSRLLYYMMRLFVKSSPRRFAANSHDQAFLEFLQREDSLQSLEIPVPWISAMIDYQQRFANAASSVLAVQIIQGTEDGTVDWKRNIELIEKKFPNGVTYFVEGAKHHLVNESGPYRELVFNRITELLRSC